MNRHAFVVTAILIQKVEAGSYDEAIRRMEAQSAVKLGDMACLKWIGAEDIASGIPITLPTNVKRND